MATPVDLTVLTSAVDFSSLIGAVIAVAGALMFAYVSKLAVRFVVDFIRDDCISSYPDPRDSGSDSEFCLIREKGTVWNGHGMGLSDDGKKW